MYSCKSNYIMHDDINMTDSAFKWYLYFMGIKTGSRELYNSEKLARILNEYWFYFLF